MLKNGFSWAREQMLYRVPPCMNSSSRGPSPLGPFGYKQLKNDGDLVSGPWEPGVSACQVWQVTFF